MKFEDILGSLLHWNDLQLWIPSHSRRVSFHLLIYKSTNIAELALGLAADAQLPFIYAL